MFYPEVENRLGKVHLALANGKKSSEFFYLHVVSFEKMSTDIKLQCKDVGRLYREESGRLGPVTLMGDVYTAAKGTTNKSYKKKNCPLMNECPKTKPGKRNSPCDSCQFTWPPTLDRSSHIFCCILALQAAIQFFGLSDRHMYIKHILGKMGKIKEKEDGKRKNNFVSFIDGKELLLTRKVLDDYIESLCDAVDDSDDAEEDGSSNAQEQAETGAANGEEVDAAMDGKGSSIQEQAETAAANGEEVDAVMDGEGSSIQEQAETEAANGEEVDAAMDGEGSSIQEQAETEAANGEEVDAVMDGEGSSIQEQAETEAAGEEINILTTPQKRKYIDIANRKSDTSPTKKRRTDFGYVNL
jgi:hypothetical protein